MSRIAKKLQELKAQGKKGLIVYLTAGCPDFETTEKAVAALAEAGADIIELGIPFSDPMADGPVIQKASALALKAGATAGGVLELVMRIRRNSEIPLAVMTYVNTVMHYGVERFAQEFSQAELDGVIIPDLPVEEAALLEAPLRQAGLDVVRFLAPTTGSERIRTICRQASGFIYCISSTGVTGVRKIDYTGIASVMEQARRETPIPLAVGFGVGSPGAARQAAGAADAVIVGSAVMERIMNEGVCSAQAFIRSIRQALDDVENANAVS